MLLVLVDFEDPAREETRWRDVIDDPGSMTARVGRRRGGRGGALASARMTLFLNSGR